jgi:hypothetical protein
VSALAPTGVADESHVGLPKAFWATRLPFRRRRWDPQPTQEAAVLIASAGDPIPSSSIRRALELCGGRPVAVISIARMYGSSYGLPNPGLMPTKKEMETQKVQVERAVAALEKAGIEGWGQVSVTRRTVRVIALAARARGVRHVLVVTPEVPRWRRVVEGSLVHDVSRRLPSDVQVEGLTP